MPQVCKPVQQFQLLQQQLARSLKTRPFPKLLTDLQQLQQLQRLLERSSAVSVRSIPLRFFAFFAVAADVRRRIPTFGLIWRRLVLFGALWLKKISRNHST
jgi:hypothetical protein